LERLAAISPPDKAARYRALLQPQRAKQVQRHFAENEPAIYSILRTSVVPTMLKAGVGPNLIPSEAEATLDIRAFPGEDIHEFYDAMKRVINDPAVKTVPIPGTRPEAPASRLVQTRIGRWNRSVKGCFPEPPYCPRCPREHPTWRNCAPKDSILRHRRPGYR
jgi:acetylornithine deacetylase/succinyl-diaminopimelate desuccinylase-like protein